MSWLIAIDFGTSNTTAAFAADAEPPTMLEVDGSRYLPSGVVADADGNLLTGKVAARQALVYPERAERVLKRALANGDKVVLGGRAFESAELAAAVLRRVFAEAVRFQGGQAPEAVIPTHPARWGAPVLERLRGAAELAGIGRASQVLLSEPEAAAWFYAPPSAGQVVAVFDLGGGTLDTAVLRATSGGFLLAGPPGGDGELGGEDFDEALLAWVGQQAAERDPGAWAEVEGNDSRARRDRALLRADVTVAKEDLSDHLRYEVPVPGFADGIRVTRDDLDDLIAGQADRAVAEARRTIAAAGVTPDELTGLYLTGGASRVPLIARRLWDALEVEPSLRGDPKAAVVLGALRAHVMAADLGGLEATGSGAGQPDGGQDDGGQDDGGQAVGAGALGAATSGTEETDAGQPAGPGEPGSDGSMLKPTSRPSERVRAAGKDAARTAARVRAAAWEPTTTLRKLDGATRDDPAAAVAMSPDGRYLASGGQGYLDIWDTVTGQQLNRHDWDTGGRVTAAAWSVNGALVTSDSASAGLKIWAAGAAGCQLVTVPGIPAAAALSWSPDGARIALASDDGDVAAVVVDPRDGRVTASMPRNGSTARSFVAWSPDGAWLACPGVGKGVAIWTAGGGQVRTLAGGSAPPAAAAWSHDGRRLAVCEGADVSIWSVGKGNWERTLGVVGRYFGGDCTAVAWLYGDQRVVAFKPRDCRMPLSSARVSGMVLWNPGNGKRLAGVHVWRRVKDVHYPVSGVALPSRGGPHAVVSGGGLPPRIVEFSSALLG